MPYTYACYPTPATALVTLTPDSGGAYTGVPYTDPATGRLGQACYIADNTPNEQGTTVDVSAPGYVPLRLRGFLVFKDANVARFQADDFALDVGVAETPQPPMGSSPLDIINHVYATTSPQLWSHEGCGKFTEDCCTALHDGHSAYWGHIAKSPGQNQYNGHAVDAVMLPLNVPGTAAGIYDIIFSSVSSEAKPVFNHAGPPAYELWYYPAGAEQMGAPAVLISIRPRPRASLR